MAEEKIIVNDVENEKFFSIETFGGDFWVESIYRGNTEAEDSVLITKKEMKCIADWLNKQLKEKEG